MGRRKIDHSLSTNPCSICGKMGVPLKKNTCYTCYHREHHRRNNAGNPKYLAKRRENARQWNAANPEKYKENKLKWRLASEYDLTLEEFKKMEEVQNGFCAICFGKNERGMLLSVDHDHETGNVRKLLCNKCNFLVGNVETTAPQILNRVFKYLQDHKNNFRLEISEVTPNA